MKDFSKVATVRYNRSKFDLSHGVKTSLSVGRLIPLKCIEVLPGDTFKSEMTAVARCTSSFIRPIVDNLYMDVHSFFVPLRLVYDNSEGVFGNPNPSAYVDNNLDEYPYFSTTIEVQPGTVGDYLGLPVKVNDTTKCYVKKGVSVLPFRAFALIYDQWFRNENTVSEMYVQKGAVQSSEKPNNNAWSPSNYTGKLPFVSKRKDYFTSCLPSTQKGEAVNVPIGAYLPVVTRATNVYTSHDSVNPIRFSTADRPDEYLTGVTGDVFDVAVDATSATAGTLKANPSSAHSGSSYNIELVPSNLYANANGVGLSVNDMRTAFQLQKMLEADARYGSRYNEYLLGHFGVTSPDARLQFTEYLGGGRIPISIQQVSQTSAGTETSPLGAFGANSQSVGKVRYSKGFVEHGFVMTVGCIRQIHTYSQGVPRMFFRHKREDFYDPKLANLSEQPVYTAQLFGYASSSNDTTDLDDVAFGYNEAWAEYRYEPSIITGQMRSGLSNSLDVWHLGDKYDSAPTLTSSFTNETSTYIDRALTVETSSQDNFLLDAWFDVKAIRVMPVYSVPGLIDHH